MTGMMENDGGTIKLFEWDFDGNGIYDWSSKTNGLYMFTYNKPGTYAAKLRVTDNLGYTGTDVTNITVVSSGFTAPSISSSCVLPVFLYWPY